MIRSLLTFVFLAVTLSTAANAAAKQVSCSSSFPSTIAYGDDVTNCQLTEVGQVALLNFQGNAGDKITIVLTASWSNGPCFGLYDPTNALVSNTCAYYFAGPDYTTSSDFSLAMSGQYTIRVYDYGYTQTGTFSVMLDAWYPAAVSSPLTLGQPASGTTVNVETVDDWTFSGTTSEDVTVQVDSSYSNGPCFILVGPAGTAVGNACGYYFAGPDYQARGEFTLPAAGTYVVRVYSYGYGEKGTYSLLAQCVGSCPSVTMPAISGISPSSAMAGGSAFTLTVNGSGFLSGATVQWNGGALPTTYVNGGQLTATVAATQIAAQGSAAIVVLNPGGSTSNTATLTINPPTPPPPVISLLNPTSATPGGPAFTLTVNGSGFLSGATVQWNGSALITTYASANQLTAMVSAGQIAAQGSAAVMVVNPGGSGSNIATFTIAPVLVPGWTDNFDSYALGSFPSTWMNSGNNAISVVNTFSVSPPQSLQMYGVEGGCWAAVAHRQLAVSPPFTVQVSVRNNDEALSGCHPWRGGIGLNTGPSWTTQGVYLFQFDQTGNLWTGLPGGQELASLPLLQWNTVTIAYELTDPTTVSTTYWINNQPGIVVTRAATTQESSLAWLSLFVQEGTAWFDNVEVTVSYTISGQVILSGTGVSGVVVTLSGSQSSTTKTDSSGNYSFTVPAGGSYTVTPSVTGSANPVSLTFNNLSSNQSGANFVANHVVAGPPFGSFDIPINNQTGLAGAVNVGGWALSTVPLTVQIWRDPVPHEAPAPNGLVYIQNTTFVAGTRPDVAAAYPGYLNSNAAGWGTQLLTNELPDSSGTGGLGNGTYTLHALATDANGLTTDLGAHTITVNNASSIVPFGTIDTPADGATISGTAYVNFGWALTPEPNVIPFDGSTITVFIDNVSVGHPVYNNPRLDIETLFPGYANTFGAIGYFYIDTTKLLNGLHTISWSVIDNAGHASGIGSRYFNVQN